MKRVTAWLLLLFSWQVARAEVTEKDIALVEDTDGSITAKVTWMDAYLKAAACAFYQGHVDQYDAIFVFSAIPLDFMSNVQQGWPVKQDEKGIGRMLYNQTAAFCAKKGRLSQAVKMGFIDTLPDDPDDIYKGIPMYTLSGVELMGHEFGHHWLASVAFDKGDGVKHCMLRGYEPSGDNPTGDLCDGVPEGGYNQHWAYYFNSGGVMYGNNITDLGNGQFRIYNDKLKYGPLDQYLMGLRLPEEVGPLFVADPGDGNVSSPSIPAPKKKEEIFSGTRIEFTVEDVIRVVGKREPMPDACHWKGAMIVVHAKGKPPTLKQIQKLVKYANRFEEWYAFATDGRGSFDLTLDGSGTGTPQCPGTATVPPEVPKDVGPGPEWAPERAEEPSFEPVPEAQVEVSGPAEPALSDLAPDWIAAQDVREAGPELAAECTPGERVCSADVAMRCNESGKGFTVVEDCGQSGKVCNSGICVGHAPLAPSSPSSGGCNGGLAGAEAPLALLLPLLALARRRNSHGP